MKQDVSWEILNKFTVHSSQFKIENLLQILLSNRSITTEKEKELFLHLLHPDLSLMTAKEVGIDTANLKKAVKRIDEAKEKKEQVIVYGDYDVDGITGTAILWESLHGYGLTVHPFIPSRADEGYGLSVKGIEHILEEFPQTKVIITVDNGIVANEAVAFANKKNIDVIITDHHVASDKLPDAFATIHTTKLCGAGVGWILSKEFYPSSSEIRELHSSRHPERSEGSHGSSIGWRMTIGEDHLALVALATVADLVPLTFANRIVLTKGLKVLHRTKRPGIMALCEEAKIDQTKIGVYEIGHILSPRLNAMGRISSAMDSLRLLCTKDRLKAKVLAEKHGLTNKDRQFLTQSLSDHAIASVIERKENILFVSHDTYDEGVIGLVAGKLVETYYRPSIVIAKKDGISKASARSIAGFNIIEFIRSGSHLLINAGGHPMAAGFTIATDKIEAFEKFVRENAKEFDTALLSRKLKIDCELPISYISQEVFDALQVLQPFGMSNPEPTFMSKATILSVKQIGREKNHLSFVLQSIPSLHPEQSEGSHFRRSDPSTSPESSSGFAQDDRKGGVKFNAIAFGMGEKFAEFSPNQEVEIAYTLSENEWNGNKSLQLRIKDIKRP